MKTSSDVPESYRRSLAGIDYTSPVCKINVALDRIPNFLADPNSSSDGVMPHHQATIHLNCEDSEMIERAYSDAKSGIYSRHPLIEMVLPTSRDPTLAPPRSPRLPAVHPVRSLPAEGGDLGRGDQGEICTAGLRQY